MDIRLPDVMVLDINELAALIMNVIKTHDTDNVK